MAPLDQRSLRMTPEQWANLDDLARQTNSRATKGHCYTWTALIRRIADGEIELHEKSRQQRRREAYERALADNERLARRLSQPKLFEVTTA